MKLYYFESDLGCGIRESIDIKTAKKEIIKEVGEYSSSNLLIKEATKDNLAWVKMMGGYIPDEKII